MPALTAAMLSRRIARHGLGAEPAADGVGDGDECRRDRGGARAAVGVEHVGVDVDRARAERLPVDDGAQAAADQPLDLGGPAVGAAADSRRRAAGQHRVLGRQPADRLPFEKRGHRIRQAAPSPGPPCPPAAVQHAAGTVADEPPLDRDGAKLIACPAVGSGHRHC